MREAVLPSCWATAVYLDPFSPKANPEAWSLPVLLKLRKSLKRGGRLATYSAQGAFRRALREAGFAVHRVPGWGSGSGRWVSREELLPAEVGHPGRGPFPLGELPR